FLFQLYVPLRLRRSFPTRRSSDLASAGLAALVLFGSYVEELRAHITSAGGTYSFQFSLTEPKVIIGLFIGGLLPFIFTAFSMDRSEEHTSELQSRFDLVCRLLLEK